MRCGRSGRLVVAAVAFGAGLGLLPGRAGASVEPPSRNSISAPMFGGIDIESSERGAPAQFSVRELTPARPAQDPVEEDESPTVGDPASTRRAYLVIVALVLLAVALAGFTVWYWRSTRLEPQALGRLETMSQRRWDRADYMNRRTQLDDAHEFVGGEGPLLSPAERAVVAAEMAADSEADAATDHAPTLAELVEATPEPPVAAIGGSIGDPDILKALGLDDESLGLAPALAVVPAVWAEGQPPGEDDDGPADATPTKRPAMDPLFDLGDDWSAGIEVPPPVWEADHDVSDEEVHEREATGEFARLLHGTSSDGEPPPEQQRFSLPGEPLV